MSIRHLSLLATAAAVFSAPAYADVYSARNYAMGGAGVASSDYHSAAASNGALLTRHDESDDFALILPAFSLEVSDQDEVIDTLDDLPDVYDSLEANINLGNDVAALGDYSRIISDLEDISGSPVSIDVGVNVGFARPSTSFAYAFDVRTRAEVGAAAFYDPTDEALLLQAINTDDSSLLDDAGSYGLALGAVVTEAAFTLATEVFNEGGNALSLSIAPKYQEVETYLYVSTVRDYDSDDWDDNDNDDNNINVDLGAAYSIGENLVIGLSVRDIISEDYETEMVIRGGEVFQSEYKIEPSAVLGVAYSNTMLTATVEADLVENEGFEVFDNSQFLRAGVEFNAVGVLKLRGGVRHDLEDARSDVLTAGLSFSVADTFHFDFGGSYGEDDTYGVGFDFRWTL